MGNKHGADRLHLLNALLEAVGNGASIAEHLAPDVDPVLVSAELKEIASSATEFVWSAANESRLDVAVVSSTNEWRVVFGTQDDRRVDWLATYRRPARFEAVAGGRVIVVNGASGAGKSTVLQRLQQEQSALPWVIFDEPEQVGTVRPEYLIWRDQTPALHRGYLAAIGAMASAGNLVAVAAGGRTQSDFKEHLGPTSTSWIGLFCDLEILRQREQGRTGRWGGIAEASADVHEGWRYDLTFDTSDSPDPTDIVRAIKELLDIEH